MSTLFDGLNLGEITLDNRIIMAPMSRNRAHSDGTPSELSIEYYRQRASAGLIISEATQVNNQGGSVNTPGLYNTKHLQAWTKIVDAVHAEGGKIIVQLWHSGRVSHTSMQPNNQAPVAPSAIQANAQTDGPKGERVDTSMPKELSSADISNLVQDYKTSAQYAKQAGFDGVEIHAANGYLVDQFIRDSTNKRTDAYGGSAENRVRFLKEVTSAIADVFGAKRVGVRLSPTGGFNDMSDSDPASSFGAAIDVINELDLAFLHMIEVFFDEDTTPDDYVILDQLKEQWRGLYIANGGFDANSGQTALDQQKADAISFGRPFISNPDLPKRLKLGLELAEVKRDKTYGGDHQGYTDYPFYSHSK